MFEGSLLATAPVTTVIFFVTIALSIYVLKSKPNLREEWLLYPYQIVRQGTWFTLITHGFIHANYIHLAVNMYVFYGFAFAMERQILGSMNFFLVYMGSMVISGGVSTYRKRERPDFRSLGASGAISGMVMSFILFNPNAEMGILFVPVAIKAWILGIIFIAVSYYWGRNRVSFIDHEGHLWGALGGVAITVLLEPGVVNHFLNSIL